MGRAASSEGPTALNAAAVSTSQASDDGESSREPYALPPAATGSFGMCRAMSQYLSARVAFVEEVKSSPRSAR